MWPARRRSATTSRIGTASSVSALGDNDTTATSRIGTASSVSALGGEDITCGNMIKLNENIHYEIISEDESDMNFETIETDFEDANSDDGDEDVQLTEGEIKMRLLQNSVPDSAGFYECNPNEVELCPAEVKDRRYKLKRGITADSGAGDPVFPRRMVNANKIVPSAGSRRGLHYVSATDHRIPNVGEVDLEFETCEGFSEKIKFQVADVNKALMSISDRVDHRCRVVFDVDDETGEDISHIFDKSSRRRLKLTRVGKVWVLDCSITEDFLPANLVPKNNQGFTGLGK